MNTQGVFIIPYALWCSRIKKASNYSLGITFLHWTRQICGKIPWKIKLHSWHHEKGSAKGTFLKSNLRSKQKWFWYLALWTRDSQVNALHFHCLSKFYLLKLHNPSFYWVHHTASSIAHLPLPTHQAPQHSYCDILTVSLLIFLLKSVILSILSAPPSQGKPRDFQSIQKQTSWSGIANFIVPRWIMFCFK